VADLTVPQTRGDDLGAPELGITPATVERALPAVNRPLLVLWAVIVAALAVFLAFGSVSVGAGNWIGRRMPVREIWARFLSFLADQGASPALIVLVTAAAAIALVTASYVVWLAFALRDAPAPVPDDATAGK
jgi:hypothetical protein